MRAWPHARTFLGYGSLDDAQTGQALENNAKLCKTMAEIYGGAPKGTKRAKKK